MIWWAWIALGLVLMGAEMLLVDAAFYLVFIGVAALLVGVAQTVGLDLPIWAQWVCFAILSAVLMVLFRERLYNRLRGGGMGYKDPAVGRLVDVEEDVDPGMETRVRMRGSRWNAVNIGSSTIARGSKARIARVDGLTLEITGDTLGPGGS